MGLHPYYDTSIYYLPVCVYHDNDTNKQSQTGFEFQRLFNTADENSWWVK